MIPYASRTGTLRNVAALRDHGWRMPLAPQNDLSPLPLKFGIDCGAWHAHQAGKPFDEPAFLKCVDRRGAEADWVVLPDIVAGGAASLLSPRAA